MFCFFLSSFFLPAFLPTDSPPSGDSLLGSPHSAVIGSVNGQGADNVLGSDAQSPEVQQLSPLTSPLLTDAGYVRNEDEEEARRKVGGVEHEGWDGF